MFFLIRRHINRILLFFKFSYININHHILKELHMYVRCYIVITYPPPLFFVGLTYVATQTAINTLIMKNTILKNKNTDATSKSNWAWLCRLKTKAAPNSKQSQCISLSRHSYSCIAKITEDPYVRIGGETMSHVFFVWSNKMYKCTSSFAIVCFFHFF